MDWPNIDLTDLDANHPLLFGRSDECDLKLEHKSVSRHHAKFSIDRQSNIITVEDLGSSYGTFINGRKIIKGKLTDNSSIIFGHSPPYAYKAGKLIPGQPGYAVSFKDAGFSTNGKSILQKISFDIEPGTFTAVIGQSGCGKSTLLACLSGVYETTAGEIILDGDKALEDCREDFQQNLGIVPQKDLVYEELTIEENLWYSAKIRFPDLENNECNERITNALKAVELDAHRHESVKVLSGGQRKRVNVALELLNRPRMLLLDEPTSGLDPGMEYELTDLLRLLSRKGVTVVCVTHSLSFLNFFDNVVVLQRCLNEKTSSLVYYGTPDNLLDKFSATSFADLFDSMKESELLSEPQYGIDEPESTGTTKRRKFSFELRRPKIDKFYFFKQMHTIFQRALCCFSRDTFSVVLTFAMPVLFSIAIVLSQKARESIGYYCFFLNIAGFWLGMSAGIREIVKEVKLYTRDRLSGMLPLAYLNGKLAFLTLTVFIQSAVLLITALISIKLMAIWSKDSTITEMSKVFWDTPFLSLLPLFISSLGGTITGLGISALVRSENAAVATMPLILLPQILFSRVAFGDADKILRTPTFGYIIELPSALLDWLLYIVSGVFISRPATITMQVLFEHTQDNLFARSVECGYLLALLAIYIIVLEILFIEREKQFRDWR